MFENKNWWKVLGTEVMMVAVAFGVFFFGRFFGSEDERVVAALAIAIVATAAAIAIVATAAAIAIAATAAAIVVVAIPIPVVIGAVISVVAFPAATAVAENYKLPAHWVLVSYLAEATIILFPIYLWG